MQCYNMPDYLKGTHCYKTSSRRCVLYVMQKRDLPTTGWANSHKGVSGFNIFLKIIFSLSTLKRRPWRLTVQKFMTEKLTQMFKFYYQNQGLIILTLPAAENEGHLREFIFHK